MEQRLKGKTAVITGAAGGIGRASALRFAKEGAFVYVNDIQSAGAEETLVLLKKAGGEGVLALADVTNAAEVKTMVERAALERGRLDVIYNNAGGGLDTPTHETSIEKFHQLMALNFNAVFYGVHAALPIMMKQKGGVILSTASGAGMNAVPGVAVYGAAKAAIISLMKNVAAEYGAYGIRANSISPGPMDTPSLQAYLAHVPNGHAGFAKQVPFGRLGTGEDIAAAAAFLASDDAAFITGAVVPVDGGVTAVLASPKLPS
jgi:NAD(P)-dependent dehydrogenase (short-subunit alcohol dehydrogenase family)